MLRLLVRVVARPSAAADLVTLAWAFRKRRGGVGLSGSYLAWRQATHSGDPDVAPRADDILRFARWRRDMARLMRPRR